MLKRKKYPIPAYIKTALSKGGLLGAYNNRPAYQKNDYIGWITRAVRAETKAKRLMQMLRELRGGKKYMNMNYAGK